MQGFISQLSTTLQKSQRQIEDTLRLFEGGATLPFIARYRKEVSGGMDEVELEKLLSLKKAKDELEHRRSYILNKLEELEVFDKELLKKVNEAGTLILLEDLFAPYKTSRKTLASKAKEAGLEGLARMIMAQNSTLSNQHFKSFLNKDVKRIDEAIEGAQHIISEWVAQSIEVKNDLRRLFERDAVYETKLIKKAKDHQEAFKFKDFWEGNHLYKNIPSHRFLAMKRGEDLGIIRVKLSPSQDRALDLIDRRIVNPGSPTRNLLEPAILDAWKRLLQPSLETEFNGLAKNKADQKAIDIFVKNLRELLLMAPLGQKRILAIDPGFRTGCKIVCLDETGSLLHNETIYPHEPQKEIAKATNKIHYLVDAFKTEAIAVGNGTAGRETERWIKRIKFRKDLEVYVVNEAGASIYSASKIAREEFPNYDVTVRGAVSIGRRLLDPLAELVKIDPKSIGVGQYQHDVNQKLLKESLDQTTEFVVNQVGVDLNTASKYLLRHVSGIGEKLAENIVAFRDENGTYRSRQELLKVPKLGAKAFEQAAGFLKITAGKHPLDASAVHPERYALVERMSKDVKTPLEELIHNKEQIQKIKPEKYVSDSIGLPTIQDILRELEKPGRDPRKKAKIFEFDASLQTIEDVREGMILPGIIQNVTNFGAFVNIGIKQNGLIHISEITNEFITDPSAYLHVDQQVNAKVLSVDLQQNRIALSLKALK